MNKNLKYGIILMACAVFLMPAALLLKGTNATLSTATLFLCMFLELIGLIFVVLSIIKKKNTKVE
jgi:hypothetical protein